MPSAHPLARAGALTLVLALAQALPAFGGGVTLRWTAPGDDGSIGRATAYDLRWAPWPIDDSNFADATPVSGEPAPAIAGTAESFRIEGLTDGAVCYFALRAADERSNWGPVSNLAAARIGSTAGVEEGARRPLLGTPVPNPARSVVRFDVGEGATGPLTAIVFDAAGRRVRTLVADAAGRAATLVWDLTDAAGARVPVGWYLVRAASAGRSMVRRVMVVR